MTAQGRIGRGSAQVRTLGCTALLFMATVAPALAEEVRTGTTAAGGPLETARMDGGPRGGASNALAPKPQPYMLPFQLRGAGVGKVLRIESVAAYLDTPAGASPTYAGFATGAYNFTPELGAFLRIGYANGSPGNRADRGGMVTNPALGAVYALKLPFDLRLAAQLAVSIPIGGGGGDTPDPLQKAARGAAVLARSAMDNTILSSNDLGIMPGFDLAYVNHGVTLQLEATLNIALRMRGELDQPDETKLNLTGGVFAGYFIAPWISIGTEVRFQRWLQPPKAVDVAMNRDALMSQLSFAVGPRFHLQVGEGVWLRPAVAYARGLDEPMTTADHNVVQLDLPMTF